MTFEKGCLSLNDKVRHRVTKERERDRKYSLGFVSLSVLGKNECQILKPIMQSPKAISAAEKVDLFLVAIVLTMHPEDTMSYEAAQSIVSQMLGRPGCVL